VCVKCSGFRGRSLCSRHDKCRWWHWHWRWLCVSWHWICQWTEPPCCEVFVHFCEYSVLETHYDIVLTSCVMQSRYCFKLSQCVCHFVCLSVCAKPEKLLIRRWCNLLSLWVTLSTGVNGHILYSHNLYIIFIFISYFTSTSELQYNKYFSLIQYPICRHTANASRVSLYCSEWKLTADLCSQSKLVSGL